MVGLSLHSGDKENHEEEYNPVKTLPRIGPLMQSILSPRNDQIFLFRTAGGIPSDPAVGSPVLRNLIGSAYQAFHRFVGRPLIL